MKRVKKIVAAVVALVVLVFIAVIFWIDHVAKAGVEVGATYALGVETTLDDMDVGMFSGSVEMADLNVANPEGCSSPHFLQLGEGRVDISLGTLMEDKVVIPELTLSGLRMTLEHKNGKANYKTILDNLKKLESKSDPAPDDEGSGKRFVINKVAVNDVEVQVELLPVGGSLTRVPVKIERIEVQNVGSDSDQGVMLAKLTGILIKAILTSVVQQAGSALPGDIAAELNSGLAQLEGLGGASVQVVGEVTAVAADVATKAGRAGEDLGKAAEEAGKGIAEGIGGLLGGKDEKKDK